MTKNETTYDFVDSVLLEFATLVVGVAEVPSTNLDIHRAKFQAVIELRNAARTVLMEMIEKKIVGITKESVN